MSELKACPFCKCTEIVAGKDYADGSYRVDCLGCFARIKANSLELAIKEWQSRPIEDELRAEIARRDEIIARLKEDAERLANIDPDVFCCQPHEYFVCSMSHDNTHDEDCPMVLHRALMKELE